MGYESMSLPQRWFGLIGLDRNLAIQDEGALPILPPPASLLAALFSSSRRTIMLFSSRHIFSAVARRSQLVPSLTTRQLTTSSLGSRSSTTYATREHICRRLEQNRLQIRSLSTPSDQSIGGVLQSKPPDELTPEMTTGVQDATDMYMRYGIGQRALEEIAKSAGKEGPSLIERWQKMMEAFLGTQVHVLAGLGYAPNEEGMALYNQQLAMLMQTLDPQTQEKVRVQGRDTWRLVLSTAFNVPLEEIESKEMSIVDARNAMHKVSLRMLDQTFLDIVKKKCDAVEAPREDGMTPAEMQMRHSIVQEAMISHVYLGGEPTLVSELGFGEGERGYVFLQLVMSEHQSDPLVAQYVSSGMMQVLNAAGLDPATLQKIAEKAAENK